jgi:hypothetical protein
MAANEINRSAKMPPQSCSVCGSVWFRLATFLSSEPQSRLQAPFLVCLCGTVVTPRLSGARETRPPSEQLEIDRLYAALANVRSQCLAITDAAALAAVAVGDTATLTSRIARLERSCEPLRQRLLPTSTAVTRSRPPRRTAATHGLDKIALELQRAGLLNFRHARRAVWALRDLWKAALADGQAVETPLGVLSARRTRSGRSRFVLEALPDLYPEVEVNPPE